jgi:putative restriction endonuclease
MVGEADARVRRAVFDWLARQRDEGVEVLARDTLAEGIVVDGRRVPLLGPQGIFKPAVCELPLSITTVWNGPYPDGFDAKTSVVTYAYRGSDPLHRDNVGLRRAWQEQVPLVYFFAIAPSRYLAQWPVLVVGDDPASLRFAVQVEDPLVAAAKLGGEIYDDAGADARRGYVTRLARQRLHQAAFRDRVIRAYRERCALCSLRHLELLDAAHITPDLEADSYPIVSNGLALCKLHHAAFDRFFFAVRPDYTVEVRPSILTESDGPMLVVGLQQIHQKRILLPGRRADLPDQDRLARRYEEFLRAS